MTNPAVDASVYTDSSGLAALKRQARADDPQALRTVAKQFESVFAKMMIKSMRDATASFGDPLFGSDQQQFYQGMYDDQLALELTKGRGLGLADMLVQQLGGNRFAKAGSAAGPAGAVAAGAGAVAGAASAGAGADGAHSSAQLPRWSPDIFSSWSPSQAGAAALTSSDADAEQAANPAGSALPPQSSQPAKSAQPADAKTILTPEEFLTALWPCAEAAGKELGVDPRHLLAQAALESNWGRSQPCDTDGNPSNNLFGIKATGGWQGNSVSVRTLEFEGGVPVPKQARFRAYESAADSFRDYVALLRDNPRYAKALNTGNDAKAFATALQRGGYATDPAYAAKITAIAQNLASAVPAQPSTAVSAQTTGDALKSGEPQPITTLQGTL